MKRRLSPPATDARAALKQIPGPRGKELANALWELGRRPHEFLLELTLRYGPIVSLRFPLEAAILVSDPGAIQFMLHQNCDNYVKQTGRWRAFRELVGDGLLTIDGDVWRHQRQRIQPAFHHERLVDFEHLLASAVSEMFDRWRTLAAEGRPVGILREMLRLTLVSMSRTMFGRDVGSIAEAAIRAFASAHIYINPMSIANLFDPPHVLRRMLAPGFRDFQRALEWLQDTIDRIVAERRASGEDTGDLLSMLISARDEDAGETMTARAVRDEVMTILQAGHEPTAIGLAWTAYLLSKQPAVRRELRAEVDRVLAGRFPAMADLPNLKLNRMVIEESMRLYPPVWGFDRKCVADDELGGYRIPAGATVGVCSYAMHRLPTYWENPEGFDPWRFAPENSAARPQYAYFPFGGGPRRCIGYRFALTQMQIVTAAIVQHFDLNLVPGPPVVPRPALNLPPASNFLMQVRPRSAPA